VEFDSPSYTAPENSLLRATLVLSGGTFSSRITVGVIPSEQSPVSAQGDTYYAYHICLFTSSYYITGNNVDFNSRQAFAFFSPGSSQAIALIDLTCDRVVENDEEFLLTLFILPSSVGVTVGSQSTATAIITDLTSETVITYISLIFISNI